MGGTKLVKKKPGALHKQPAQTMETRELPLLSPVEETAPAAEEDFWADPRRVRCLELIVLGSPKAVISRELNVHRNTINNWCKDQRFAMEAKKRLEEHMAAKRIHRMQTTNRVNDTLGRVTIALLKDVEETLRIGDDGKPHIEPKDRVQLGQSVNLFRLMGYEFREFREQERKDFGDDIKKVAINNNTTITGDIQHSHSAVNDSPFADVVKRAIHEKVIDVESIEVPDHNPGLLLQAMTERLLVDTDLLERINAEDVAAEEAEKASKGK